MVHRILEIFTIDHDKLNELFLKFMRLYNKESVDVELMKTIRFNLKRHIYLEEKTIFISPSLIQNIPEKTLLSFLEDHNKIIQLVDSITEKYQTGEKADITELGIMVEAHQKFEIPKIYQELEQYLDQAQIDHIFTELSKASTLGFYPISKIREYGAKQLKQYRPDFPLSFNVPLNGQKS